MFFSGAGLSAEEAWTQERVERARIHSALQHISDEIANHAVRSILCLLCAPAFALRTGFARISNVYENTNNSSSQLLGCWDSRSELCMKEAVRIEYARFNDVADVP